VDIFWGFPEVDKVSKYIECIREEKKPENKKHPMKKSSLFHCHHREKIWDHRKDEIPDESSEDHISREVDTQDGEKSSVETEDSVGVEMHSEL
jgi:hypothetical protein